MKSVTVRAERDWMVTFPLWRTMDRWLALGGAYAHSMKHDYSDGIGCGGDGFRYNFRYGGGPIRQWNQRGDGFGYLG